MRPTPSSPIDGGALAHACAAAAAGTAYKPMLEELLRELEPEDADALMLLLKESRGAWALLLGSRSGRALFVGDALSGTVAALSFLGFELTVVDRSTRRLALAHARDRAVAGGHATFTVAASGALPFTDGGFDLVVAELEGGRAASEAVRGELARLSRGEVAVVVNNRLAYKRSTGRRGAYHVPRPIEWLRGALRPAGGERSLASYRRVLGRDFARTRAFALYPDAREFSHVVGLDSRRPRLTIGPQERRNRLKLAARAAGLFPLLTPSFALLCDRGERGPTRLERILTRLAEHLDEPRPEVDMVVATRSNVALIQTAPKREDAERGRWTLHVPLGPQKAGMTRTHFGFLREIRARFPAVPVPEPLWLGEVEGLPVCCERRLGGESAPQLTGDQERTARMLSGVSRLLEQLVVESARPFTRERFEELLAGRFRLVRDRCAVRSTAERIDDYIEWGRERLVGEVFPLVVYHADLRPKHVQVDASGDVLGLLDWGASEKVFLPGVDLLHLIAHQRKQEEDETPARAWEILRKGELRPWEREPLETYARELELPEGLLGVLAELHPLLVAGMAERNWDYSRPRWLHTQFGV